MSITTTTERIRVESAAKNGTLSTQGTLNANQIKFDTNISTNNGDLETSPVFRKRIVVVRRGDADEEHNYIQSVDVDGVTCTCLDNWTSAPVSGDTYDISYGLDDVTTKVGCVFETDSRQWVLTKRLVIGDGTNFAFLAVLAGQVVRLADRGALEPGLRVVNAGRFQIGTIRDDKATFGGVLIFQHDTNGENCLTLDSGSIIRLYDFTMASARRFDVVSLDITNNSTDVDWARSKFYGIDAPAFKTQVKRYLDIYGEYFITKADLKNAGMWNGWCKSELDKSVFDALSAEGDSVGIRLLVEG